MKSNDFFLKKKKKTNGFLSLKLATKNKLKLKKLVAFGSLKTYINLNKEEKNIVLYYQTLKTLDTNKAFCFVNHISGKRLPKVIVFFLHLQDLEGPFFCLLYITHCLLQRCFLRIKRKNKRKWDQTRHTWKRSKSPRGMRFPVQLLFFSFSYSSLALFVSLLLLSLSGFCYSTHTLTSFDRFR